MSLVSRLYRGETEFPLIRRRKLFYLISIGLVTISLATMVVRGFNLGVEFSGGSTFQFPANGRTEQDARQVFEDLGVPDVIPQTVGRAGGAARDIRVQTEPLPPEEIDRILPAVAQEFGIPADQINPSSVGPAWGQQVTTKALQGLGLFLVAVIAYISLRFEPKMAAAAIVALVHDLILTAGIYAITQFVVTPSTIIALLTVLGYSLYDTIVVFDKVEENTRGLSAGSRSTYSEAAELAVNQTFMRSINTSLIALLPVSGLLFVGAFLLGAGTLKDLALALFVGLASGAYSSLFLATPLLADMKEREPQYRALTARVLARRSGAGRPGARAAARPGSVLVAAAPGASGAAAEETDGEPAAGPAPGAESAPGAAPAPTAAPAVRRRPGDAPGKRRGGAAGRRRR